MKRLDEIQLRADKAYAELDRLTEGNPGTNWRWGIPANPDRDSDLILGASQGDVKPLLAAVQAVLDEHSHETFIGYCKACGYIPPCPTVRAVTAALGGV